MNDELERLQSELRATEPRASAIAREHAISEAKAAFERHRQGTESGARHKREVWGNTLFTRWLRRFTMPMSRPSLVFAGSAAVLAVAGIVTYQALMAPDLMSTLESAPDEAAPAESQALSREFFEAQSPMEGTEERARLAAEGEEQEVMDYLIAVESALAGRKPDEAAEQLANARELGHGLPEVQDLLERAEDELGEARKEKKKKQETANRRDGNGDTPLYKAAASAKVSEMKRLIADGAEVDARNQNEERVTALMTAAKNNAVGVVRVLVKAGANVNLQDKGGFTALTYAAWQGGSHLVKELIKAGADVNLQNQWGQTALTYAASRGFYSAAPVLIKAGTNVNLQDKDGFTVLMHAALNGEVRIVRELIEAGADVNLQNKDERTAIIFAVIRSVNLEVVRELIKAGADVNSQDLDGMTALIVTADGPFAEAVGELVEAGANVNLQDKDGQTALMAAAGNAEAQSMRILIKAGASVDLRDKYGQTALMLAAWHPGVVEGDLAEATLVLIEAGANVNLKANDGDTALMNAARPAGNIAAMRELIEAGADVNTRNSSDETALDIAIDAESLMPFHSELAVTLIRDAGGHCNVGSGRYCQ